MTMENCGLVEVLLLRLEGKSFYVTPIYITFCASVRDVFSMFIKY